MTYQSTRDGERCDTFPRCPRCNKLLAEQVARPWRIRCARCGMIAGVAPVQVEVVPASPAERPKKRILPSTRRQKRTRRDNGLDTDPNRLIP